MEVGRRRARQRVEQSTSERQSRLGRPTKQHKARPATLRPFLHLLGICVRNPDNLGERRVAGPSADPLPKR
ncbi:hypothetical protein PMIN01_13028 [Paraphaeosphaeria minitans]|uniref:Uncharacterized protein n=1 Tax=Paraphaeosphaeria minitans TaxID=565426 RepID=A0A9P6KJF9_9PLEO|nr:hypothetical protein PMIN01_13028 [Paraphaeosphaeria minitans]